LNDVIIATDGEDRKWVEASLNSMLKELQEGPKFIHGDESNPAFYITKRFVELHKQIKEKFSDKNLIPPVLGLEEINKNYQYAKLYYVFTTINQIADALEIKLKDKNQKELGQIIAQYQNLQVTQINVQTIENVIENINKLDIDFNTKTEIVKLVKEFDKEAKGTKDPQKLKDILLKVGKLSAKAGAYLFEHAEELGLLSLLMGA